MFYGSYQFLAAFTDEAVLPPFKGSTFRGFFGGALKKVVCALKHQECAACLLQRQCVYALVFESLTPKGEGRPSPPHPFVIEPPLTTQTHFHPGDSFAFRLLLFGWANDYLPYFIYAFQEMGRLGLGKRLSGRRAGFTLDQVTDGGQIIYDGVHQNLVQKTPPELVLEAPPAAAASPASLTVRLQTPLRLKFQNTLRAELPFHLLIRAALRRLATLNQHYGGGEPPLDYRGLVARAQAVAIQTSRLQWFDWQRYSNRQDKAMLMGGMIGAITYQGNLAEFLPLLRYAEKVHLGKATTFGLGKIAIEFLND